LPAFCKESIPYQGIVFGRLPPNRPPEPAKPIDNQQVPFTPAHAAAALPFRHTRLIPSALIIGTMAPDFEYFLRLAPSSGYGHTLIGAITLTLPLGLLVLWLFQISVKPLAISLMPRDLQLRLLGSLARFSFLGTSRLPLILASLLVGIATHLAWDNFTHPHTWLNRHWAFLQDLSTLPIVGPVPHYKILQHLSTLLGLGLLCAWFANWYRTTAPVVAAWPPGLRRFSAARKAYTVIQIVVIATAGSFVRVLASLDANSNPSSQHQTPEALAGQAICAFIALVWWQLVAYGILTRARRNLHSTPASVRQ